MRWLLLALLGCAGGSAAFELPRPTERASVLPGEDWMPRARPASALLAGERPLPELALQLDELRLHRPLHSRLSVQLDLVSLRSTLLRQWQFEGGLELHLPSIDLALRRAGGGWSMEQQSGRNSVIWETALLLSEGPWRIAFRQRAKRDRSISELALQLRRSALQFGVGRESSPYGTDALWQFGAQFSPSRRLRLGARLREDSADLQLRMRRGSLRLSIAVAASGALRGGVAWALEWSP